MSSVAIEVTDPAGWTTRIEVPHAQGIGFMVKPLVSDPPSDGGSPLAPPPVITGADLTLTLRASLPEDGAELYRYTRIPPEEHRG